MPTVSKTAAPIFLALALSGFANLCAAQEARKLFIEGDIVRGRAPEGATGPLCVLANQFMRKENVVFRMRVRNVAGQPLDDKNLKGLMVELADGQKIQARYASRPPQGVITALGLAGPTDYYWTAAWLIPESYPTGTVTYKVVATDMLGNSQDWQTFNDPRSWPVVVAGVAQFASPQAPSPAGR